MGTEIVQRTDSCVRLDENQESRQRATSQIVGVTSMACYSKSEKKEKKTTTSEETLK